jgi:hypothetical protein
VLCWADGILCAGHGGIQSPREVRREAVAKLVSLAWDPAAAAQILKEFEAAEEGKTPRTTASGFAVRRTSERRARHGMGCEPRAP